MRSDHQVRLNTVMIPVTVAKIMVPMSGTKIAQDSQSPWLTTARIRNSTETPTMRFARTSSILWPALATTAAMIAAAPTADPRIWSTAIRAPAASSPGSTVSAAFRASIPTRRSIGRLCAADPNHAGSLGSDRDRWIPGGCCRTTRRAAVKMDIGPVTP
jgi:hypothetical protein